MVVPPPGGASTAVHREPSSSIARAALQFLRVVNGPVFARPRRAYLRSHTHEAQRGVSGLETAIIMIAFVVVASVFAMTTLQTGVFSAEQGKQAALSGLDQATGSLHLRGSVRAVRGDVDVDGNDTILLSGVDDQAVAKVIFTVTGAVGSSMADLTPPYTADSTGVDPDASGLTDRTSIAIQTDNLFINDAAWTVTFPGSDNGDYILDDDERAEITVWLHSYDNTNVLYDLGTGTGDPYVDAATDLLGTNDEFTIQVHTPKGATLNIQRTIPVVLRPQMDLR